MVINCYEQASVPLLSFNVFIVVGLAFLFF